ncbi:Nuclear transport factor 2 [Modicella reniformis]|uniref:Nuclear transport factor 2 n=1 Tax=Modicella reniformis TaxID=1440133 RepID=A0A9P6IL78_9FUNG|nr:Nuclear transport factor 2 [Modicella reniformis]
MSMSMANLGPVVDQFIGFYYPTFATSRAALSILYRDTSLLSWEGSQFRGSAAIIEKLASLPFQSVSHRVATQDFQPGNDYFLITITGQLLVDGESNPQFFAQTFVLKSDAGVFYISNEVFRLVYG